MQNFLKAIALICALTLPGLAAAQSKAESATNDGTGFTSYVEFNGSSNSAGQAYELDPTIGYTFTKHFGMDFGLPFYFVNGSAAGSVSGRGVGNPSFDLRWKFPNSTLNYGTMITLSAPWGDKSLGLNTGHITFDWSNHFDHAFDRLTPFFEAGFANTTLDTRLFVRPYTSYGFNTHYRAGAEFDVWKSISIGAAGYDIAPFGNQTVTPRTHGRQLPTQQITGSSSLAKDDGYSAWVDASLNRYIDTELGFTRSAQFDLNSVSFSIGLNVGRLVRGGK